CARLPPSLAAVSSGSSVPAPRRALTSARSLRASLHRPLCREELRS
ncbi:MAG: hypothetical protein AVDCRST_MAG55-2359, partial [uncultured Rubrobacteraceae bacterium]